MKSDDIKRLATLARIELTPLEVEGFAHDISGILEYVETVKEITGDAPPEKVTGALANVMREDKDPHEPGMYTDDLLAAAPLRDGRYVKVKKILEEK